MSYTPASSQISIVRDPSSIEDAIGFSHQITGGRFGDFTTSTTCVREVKREYRPRQYQGIRRRASLSDPRIDVPEGYPSLRRTAQVSQHRCRQWLGVRFHQSRYIRRRGLFLLFDADLSGACMPKTPIPAIPPVSIIPVSNVIDSLSRSYRWVLNSWDCRIHSQRIKRLLVKALVWICLTDRLPS